MAWHESRCRALWFSVLWVLLALGCGRETGPPNVILIGIDTLRPDHLGCYGYERPTSPNIDGIARRGVVFENTVSQCPWTLPSFATVFTSLYPTQHGAGTLRTKMRSTFPTLAEILADAGYATGAVISAPVLDSGTGIGRGFQHYDARQDNQMRAADEVTARGLEWIDDKADRPFFLFLHYWDPHDPYSPPTPYDTTFDPSYEGGLGNSVSLRTLGFSSAAQVGMTLSDRAGRISDRDLEHTIALYDGEIAFTDSMIGELLKGLEERNLHENTLIVVHSDHGEEFFEHNGVGHGHTVYNELIRVVLVMAYPRAIPGRIRVERQVRLLDVAPTILDLVNLGGVPGFEGASLTPLIEGKDIVPSPEHVILPPSVAYTEGIRESAEKKALTAHPWKLIYDLASTDEDLFNLMEDPGETDDLFEKESEAAVPLEEILARALFEMSDQWYIEVAGGEDPHKFDLTISADAGLRKGWICPLNTRGNHAAEKRSAGEVLAGAAGPAFEINNLTSREPLTMGFRIHAPRGMRPTMDFRVDGRPARDRTFIGEALDNPNKMPFRTPTSRAKTTSASGPSVRPDPPYVLVWRVESTFGDEVQSELSEDVKKELRALGYIQ